MHCMGDVDKEEGSDRWYKKYSIKKISLSNITTAATDTTGNKKNSLSAKKSCESYKKHLRGQQEVNYKLINE